MYNLNCSTLSFTYYIKKEVHVWPFMNEKSDGMTINRHFEDEIRRCSRLHCLTQNTFKIECYALKADQNSYSRSGWTI